MSAAPPQGSGEVKTSERGPALVLEHRWFRENHVLSLIFLVPWFAFLVWLGPSLYGAAHWGPRAALALFAALGAGLAYWALAGVCNRTVVEVSPNGVRVRHGPLPWTRGRDLDPAAVERVVVETVHRLSGDSGHHTAYRLRAHLRGSASAVLLSGIEDEAAATEAREHVEGRLRASLPR